MAWLAAFILFFFPAAGGHAAPLPVTVVLSESGGPYLEFGNALREILSGKGLSVALLDAGKPVPESGLTVAVGMKAAAAVAASHAPSVLNVLIPKAGHEKLQREFPQRDDVRAYSAIFLEQPIERQLRLIAAVLPGKRNIGVLYSSPLEDMARLRRKAVEQGLSLQGQAVGDELPLAEALQELLQHTDVLLALPDSSIYNSSTIRNILLATYRNRVPLVGFSPAYVKAGALCALSSSPDQIAIQAAAVIVRFGEAHALPAPAYPQEFEVLLNEQVSRSLGLHVKDAATLQAEIKAGERGGQ